MNIIEACNILEINTGASKEELDKAFRKLAAIHHPDRNPNNKEESEAKFKKISEAYEFLKKNGTKSTTINFDDFFKSPGHSQWPGNPFSSQGYKTTNTNPNQYKYYNYTNQYKSEYDDTYDNLNDNLNDIFNEVIGGNFNYRVRYERHPFEQNQSVHYEEIPIRITFQESILGCTKEINVTKTNLCDECGGNKYRFIKTEKPCNKCDGKGSREIDGKTLPCSACRTSGYEIIREKCYKCDFSGFINSKIPETINIPPGVYNGEKIPLYKSGVIKVNVIPDNDMFRDGNDVISTISISLLDALKGSSIKVKTVMGEKTLKIKPLTKNKDLVRVKGFGVAGTSGSHIFEVIVNYPDCVQNLIDILDIDNKKD